MVNKRTKRSLASLVACETQTETLAPVQKC